jgi:biopolymer transport protein ExbD
LQVTLPTAEAEKAQQRPPEIHVLVDAQGRYAINNVQIAYRDVAGLAEDLRRAAATASGQNKQDPVLIINADALATHQTVINIMEAARIAGLPQLTFAAQSGGAK